MRHPVWGNYTNPPDVAETKRTSHGWRMDDLEDGVIPLVSCGGPLCCLECRFEVALNKSMRNHPAGKKREG